MPFVIGLTGNIACGKSRVGAVLRELGAEYVDADTIVHAMLAADSLLVGRVVDRFGSEVARADGSIDRRALGERVFRNPGDLADLETILHPEVRREIERRIASASATTIVLDAIKLIESGLVERADSVWVVTCSRATQTDRLVGTRGLTPEQAAIRIDAQGPQEHKVRRADVVIDNEGTLEALRARVREAYDRELAAWSARGGRRGGCQGTPRP
jgi:dephospho-CoA kinase